MISSHAEHIGVKCKIYERRASMVRLFYSKKAVDYEARFLYDERRK